MNLQLVWLTYWLLVVSNVHFQLGPQMTSNMTELPGDSFRFRAQIDEHLPVFRQQQRVLRVPTRK